MKRSEIARSAMVASRYGHKEIVELLLEHDADINIWDDEDKLTLDLAKTEEIKELLLNWKPKDAKRAKGCNRACKN